jgi:tetratricopeptide (TPR) repeat protein
VTLLVNKRQFEEAQKIAQEALSLAQTSRNKNSEARAYLALGRIGAKQKQWQPALTNYNKAEQLGEAANEPLLLSEVYHAKAVVYLIKQETEQALKYYKLALGVATKHQLFEKMAQVQKSLVYFYKGKKQYKRSLEYAAEALKNGELSGDERLIAEYTALLATCYKLMGNYIKALDYHLKALKIRETFLKNHWDLAQNYNKIGVLLYEQQNYAKAIDYYAKFLAVAKHRKDDRFIAIGYNNLALAYQHLKQYDKAKNYYHQSIGFAQKSNTQTILGWAYNGLGIVAQENQQYAQAKEWFDKAIGVRTRARLLGQSYFGLGKNYQLQQQYTDAKQYYLKAADLAQKSVDLSLKRDVYEGLSICYEALGELSKALTNHQLFKKFAKP